MIKEFTIGYSRTINLGNYESARVEASVTMTLPADDPYNEKYRQEQDYAQKELRRLLEETWKAQNQPKPKDHKS